MCRRTTLSAAFGHKAFPTNDPLGVYSVIQTTGVQVLRGSQTTGYAFLKEPFTIDVLSVAAFEEGKYCSTGVGTERITEPGDNGVLCLRAEVVVHTRRKLDMLLSVAAAAGNPVLILSALGCGGFKNPPHEIAQLFREVLPWYLRSFQTVVFAITGANAAPFKQIFDAKLLVSPATHCVSRWNDLERLPCKFGGQCCLLDNLKHWGKLSHAPR